MSFIECSGCHKNFGIHRYSQHIAKTQNPQCQLSHTPPHVSASQSTHIRTLTLDLFMDEDMEDSAPTVPTQSGDLNAMLTGIC